MADLSKMCDRTGPLQRRRQREDVPATPKKRFRKTRDDNDGVVLQISTPNEATKTIITPTSMQRSGRWTFEEKLLFLHGLKVYGKGRWKKIRSFLPTRTLIQIKSHAQKVLKREEAGDDIFAPLNANTAKVQTLIGDLSVLFDQRDTNDWCTTTPPLSSESPVHHHHHHSHHHHHHHSGATCQPPAMLNNTCETMDARFRFTVGDTHPDMTYGGSAIYQATIGESVGFAFPPVPPSEAMFPLQTPIPAKRTPFKGHLPNSDQALGSLVLVAPEKNSKCTDVLAAAALCELSSIGRKGKKVDPERDGDMVHIVSP